MSDNGPPQSMTNGPVIGIVWPGPATHLEVEETMQFVPPGVALHSSSPAMKAEGTGGITLERVEALAESSHIEEAAATLTPSGVAAICYACTSASYVRGPGGDVDIIDRITSSTGIPASTTSTAMIKALRHLKVQRVSVLSPHIDPLNERLTTFLEAADIEVVAMTGLNMKKGIDELKPESNKDLIVKEVDHNSADGIFISCTSMRAATVLNDIEQQICKPVVTAIQASLWDLLRLAGWSGQLQRRGRLFR